MKRRIIGNKVVLRQITLDDTPLIVKWCNNPGVSKKFLFRKRFATKMYES